MSGTQRVRKTAYASAFLAIVLTIVVSSMIRMAQVDRVASIVRTFSGVFTAKMEEQLRARLSLAEIMQQALANGLVKKPEDFGSLSATFHHRFEDLQAVNWVGNTGRIEQVTPLGGNEEALGLDVLALAEPRLALEDSARIDRLQITPPITLAQGGRGLTAYAPVRADGEITGYINLVFRIEPMIKSVLGEEAADSFNVSVFDGTEPLYVQEGETGFNPHAIVTPIEVGGRTWTTTIVPTAAEVAKAQTFLDEAILLAGCLLSIFLATILNGAARNRETLVKSEERFSLAMKGASDGLFDLDYTLEKAFFSPRWFRMLGYKPNALPQNLETFAKLLHPEDAVRVLKTPKELFQLPGEVVEEEFRMQHKDGHWVTILSRAAILRRAGKVERVVGTHVDISELKRQQSELERAAHTDDLTGLRNRRGLSKALLNRAKSMGSAERVALFHLDLDRFKSINDMNGHEAGDHVLRTSADRLIASLTFFDIIARVGGDEFLLAKTTRESDADVLDTASQIVEQISRPIPYAGKQLRVGASIGIAFVRSVDTDEIEQATANADIALYTSKSLGRGRCILFEPGMRAAAVRTVELSSEIREGLELKEFKPFFQPQIDIHKNEIIGFEALARWYHPTRGVLSAADFVSFAEDAYLLEAIDDQIFEQACEAIPEISAMGAAAATISVNVSTARLGSTKLLEKLVETARRTQVGPAQICIEILESTLLSERTTNITRNIADLSDAGFRLELDDFGTGHTAIASLRNFPVSRIKIDRSLISGVQRDPKLQAIASAIVDLGSKLDIEVLAEGVETWGEIGFLEALGCSQFQGFLIAPPCLWRNCPLGSKAGMVSLASWRAQCRTSQGARTMQLATNWTFDAEIPMSAISAKTASVHHAASMKFG